MTVSKLDELLYADGNVGSYLDVLNNNKFMRLLFPKGSLEHLRLNAYLLFKDDNMIVNSIAKIDGMHLNKGEKVDYCLQKLSYYATNKEKEKALTALNELEQVVDSKHHDILDDAKIIYRLYVEEDERLFVELNELASSQKELNRGVTYFRLARLSYVKNNEDDMLKYLKLAKELLNNTVYVSIINDIYHDHSLILKY